MFTGLIEETGTIREVRTEGGARRITVGASRIMEGLKIDDSVAINGCCQTVIDVGRDRFTVVAVEETLRKTTLGTFAPGLEVNLERALRVGDRLGGHFVQGHVDCVGHIVERHARESSWIFRIEFPEEFAGLVIPVGSIAIDGVSLTAAEADATRCMVSIIPHTYQVTTFNRLNVGDRVNLEFDMVGKYIRNFVQPARAGLTGERLRELGY